MDKYWSYSSNVAGRDKVYRFVQYLSKFLSWYGQRHGDKNDIVKMLTQLEKSMSTSRKLFRFGRSLEALRSARRAINLQSYILSLTLTTSHTNKAVFLLIDHYIWMGRVGILTIDDKYWSDKASRFWLLSLILGFIRDLYALRVSTEKSLEDRHNEKPYQSEGACDVLIAVFRALKNNPQATMDLIKNGCDIVIPANSLGIINVNNGVVGLCGVLSSVLAALQVCSPQLKLAPN